MAPRKCPWLHGYSTMYSSPSKEVLFRHRPFCSWKGFIALLYNWQSCTTPKLGATLKPAHPAPMITASYCRSLEALGGRSLWLLFSAGWSPNSPWGPWGWYAGKRVAFWILYGMKTDSIDSKLVSFLDNDRCNIFCGKESLPASSTILSLSYRTLSNMISYDWENEVSWFQIRGRKSDGPIPTISEAMAVMAILDSAFNFCVPASLGFALNFFVLFGIRSPSTQGPLVTS